MAGLYEVQDRPIDQYRYARGREPLNRDDLTMTGPSATVVREILILKMLRPEHELLQPMPGNKSCYEG